MSVNDLRRRATLCALTFVVSSLFASLGSVSSARADQTTVVWFHNNSGVDLILNSDPIATFVNSWWFKPPGNSLCTGVSSPPSIISAGTCVAWGAGDSGAFNGESGRAVYQVGSISGPTLAIAWDNDWDNGGFINFGGASATATVESPLYFTGPIKQDADGDGVVDKDGRPAQSSDGDGHMNEEVTFDSVGASISSNAFPTSGTSGTTITILGKLLDTSGLTDVWFGQNKSSNVKCASSTSCTALAPPGSGTVPVTAVVRGKAASAGVFSYVPSVTALGAYEGYTGDTLNVAGLGFNTASGYTAFKIGPYAVPNWNVHCSSSTACSIVVPPGTGTGNVVATVNGTSSLATPDNRFTYGAPFIATLTPASGATNGGENIMLNGDGFDSSMTVYFGSKPSPKVTCIDHMNCQVLTPGGGIGSVPVTVSLAGATSASKTFTYVYRPAVQSVMTPSWVVWSGTTVTGYVLLNEPADTGGTLVSLSTFDSSLQNQATGVSVPTTVVVPMGHTSASFNIIVSDNPLLTGVSVVASTANSSKSTALLPRTGSVWLDIDTNGEDDRGILLPGSSDDATVWIRGTAPAGGASVSVSDSNRAVLSVPSAVTVPAGASKGSFSVTAQDTDTTVGVVVTAAYANTSSTARVRVGPDKGPKPPPCKGKCE